ncbi:hypothetical protein ABZ372_40610, partial [Streptomyces sp. NPDC005921]
MTPYARRGVHGQTVEALARRILGGEIPEGATLDLVALQSELDVSLTAQHRQHPEEAQAEPGEAD